MKNIDEFKSIVANNLVYYRKKANLTQLELAEKLNYSDKAISKWERGETLPDTYILSEIANIYSISVDDFLHENKQKEKTPFSIKKAFKNKHVLITLLSIGLAWLVAAICFVVLLLIGKGSIAYFSFIYALPVSAIIGVVFSSIWGTRTICGVCVSLLIWTLLLSIYLSITIANIWVIFIIAIPAQVLVILWFFLMKENFKIKWHLKKRD